MTDNITLPRAVGEKVRSALSAWVRIYQFEQDMAALAALDAALAEPPAKPKPVVVEQLFALANLTVRRAADPDPWVWDRLEDDGTWKPFNPLIHGPDMWRLEQALRAALEEPPATREPATVEQVIEAYESSRYEGRLDDYSEGWREAERFHGIRKENGK